MSSYVCVTAGEWRNLCSMGRIRLQETRAISCTEQLSEESYDQLFSLAADRFLLGETSDFLITEYSCLQTEFEGIQPPGHKTGVRWLLLQDVIRFFPLRSDDAWAFETDAQKAQVTLCEALFEVHWNQWFKAHAANQACINGLTLMRALGFRNSSNQLETVSPDWGALATQIINPNTNVSDASDFPAKFIKSRDRLFDLAREDLDSCALFVSCPIEWISLQSDTHIFDTDADLAEQAQLLHEKYLNVAFDALIAKSEDIKNFENLLIAKAPEAFPGAWSPSLISLYIRFSHKIQFGAPSPDDIVAAVRAIHKSDDRCAAELLAFLLGVALGSNKTHSLERSLHPKRFEAVSVPDLASIQPTLEIQTVSTTVDSIVIQTPEVKISRMTESDFRVLLGEFHVLTYAEDGFSPLDIHSRRLGVDREGVGTFVKAVNASADVGSMHPSAPISAVPREFVRERQNVNALAAIISNFLFANRDMIKARRLVFDFRTPSVPSFAIEALNIAILTSGDCGLDEILILEM
jgi:hypothetical protein